MKKGTVYMPDLFKVSLDKFKNALITGRLLPSRQSLLEDIDARFEQIQQADIIEVGSLKETLKNKAAVKTFAERTGITEDYLHLLKREVNSLLPKPIKFRDIPNLPENIIGHLTPLHIKDTEDLFPHVKDPASRKLFQDKSGLSATSILWLTKIVDVSRIKWVGAKVARLIVDTKYDTVQKLAEADSADAHKALDEAKKSNKLYDGPLGIKDIDSWIQHVVAKTPLIIKY